MPKIPTLGVLYLDERRCLRVREWGVCFRPGVWHIIWEASDASTACDECGEFAKEHRIFEAIHPMGPDCALVATMYYADEGTCRTPRSADDIRRGRIVF